MQKATSKTTILTTSNGMIVRLSKDDPLLLPLVTEKTFSLGDVDFYLRGHKSRSGNIYFYTCQKDLDKGVDYDSEFGLFGYPMKNHRLIEKYQAQDIVDELIKPIDSPFGSKRKIRPYPNLEKLLDFIPIAQEYGLEFPETA